MSKRILFIGDSITDGNRYKEKEQEWDLNHQIGHSYVYILNGILGSSYPEMDLKFINRGISGNRLIDVYGRIQKDVIDMKPDILSILVGVNDGPRQGENGVYMTSPGKFKKIYRLMLDEIRESLPECKLVICEPFVCNSGKLRKDFEQWKNFITPIQKCTKEIAEEYQAIHIPLQEKFDEALEIREGEYWCWDGIHPTENGHGLIAREWLKRMTNIVTV